MTPMTLRLSFPCLFVTHDAVLTVYVIQGISTSITPVGGMEECVTTDETLLFILGSLPFEAIFHPQSTKMEQGILDSPWRLSGHPAVHLLSVGKVSRIFLKLFAQIISYLTFILMGRVFWLLFIFEFLLSILSLWWPNICTKHGFHNYFLIKTICSINLISHLYPFVLSLSVLVHFCIPYLNFSPVVVKYLIQNGVYPWLSYLYDVNHYTNMKTFIY